MPSTLPTPAESGRREPKQMPRAATFWNLMKGERRGEVVDAAPVQDDFTSTCPLFDFLQVGAFETTLNAASEPPRFMELIEKKYC